jgi:FkbM family methyltransferase
MDSFAACYQAFGRDFYIEPASAQFANAVFHDEYRIDDLRPHNVRTIVDIGAHVGSFTVLCHHHWPLAKIVAVEPHPDSFGLLKRNTAHIPADTLLRIQAAVTPEGGQTLLASSVSHSRVGEYAADVWESLSDRPTSFGIKVPAISPEGLWERLAAFGIDEVDLLKLDCEGAEYVLLPSWGKLGVLAKVGWLRGEWHHRPANDTIAEALQTTHAYNIDPNRPHAVGLFVAHRDTSKQRCSPTTASNPWALQPVLRVSPESREKCF